MVLGGKLITVKVQYSSVQRFNGKRTITIFNLLERVTDGLLIINRNRQLLGQCLVLSIVASRMAFGVVILPVGQTADIVSIH